MKNTPCPRDVLVINAGSSSIKFSLVRPQDPSTVEHVLKGSVERLGSDEAELHLEADGARDSTPLGPVGFPEAMQAVLDCIRKHAGTEWHPFAVGHRMVHGAEHFTSSTRIHPDVLRTLEACIPMAPLHNPANLACIRAAMDLFDQVPHVAVLDTAFHQTMPPPAYLYPIPYHLYEEQGIRRYGFHGTSHRYVSLQAVRRLGLSPEDNALIIAHLGNGCSACAVRNGQSVDTTMGLTPLEGLVMGTRSGDVDPSLHQFLADNCGMDLHEITRMLNRESGLIGLSGHTNDMRELLSAADQGNERCRLAVEVFCYRLAKAVASLAVPLGRLDALVFTGGIGTYSAPVRERTVEQLGILGLTLDPERNAVHGRDSRGLVSTDKPPAVLVMETDEEGMIAMDTLETLTEGTTP